jgi:cell division control protein 6
MAINSEFEILLDEEILSETHVPTAIPAREPQIKELQSCISPALKGQKPLSAWLHGGPGTGKTAVACHLLSELNKRANVPGIYVNCWKHNSFYSVLEYMLNEMRRGFGDARDRSVKLGQFERLLKNRPFLIVLDEIDLVPSRERNTMVYNLFSVGKVGLICISESPYPILALEARIKSRLSPKVLAFEPYSVSELINILKERAPRALHLDSWQYRTLETIAEKAKGDARIAIQTLRNAALNAGSEGARKIENNHIRKGFSDNDKLKKNYQLKRLTEHHRLLYRIIKEHPGITSPGLFETYVRECEARNWKPIASRTFSLYTQKMTELKLIKAERARVRGRVHAFWTRK